jgi:hypothetical protein
MRFARLGCNLFSSPSNPGGGLPLLAFFLRQVRVPVYRIFGPDCGVVPLP